VSSSLPRDDAREAREILEERCVDQALFGDRLSLDEERTATSIGFECDACVAEFEQIAAEMDLAHIAEHSSRGSNDEIPPSLRAKLQVLAAAHTTTSATQRLQLSQPHIHRSRRLDWFAAAACVAFGAGATLAILRLAAPVNLRETTSERTSALDAGTFLAHHPKAVHWPWIGTEDDHVAGPVAGEACFDPSSGDGLLVIEGLTPNDPSREQYQLWIFDKSRDARYPVDGGVFDVKAARVALPIAAKLPVTEPVMFAVTIEKPGGAVVSDRRIALLAKP
jgi:hypothetical protein